MLLRLTGKCLSMQVPVLRVQRAVRHCRVSSLRTFFVKPQIRNFSNEYDDDFDVERDGMQLDQLAAKALSYSELNDPVLQRLNCCKSLTEVLTLSDILVDKKHFVQFLLLTGKFRNPAEPTVLNNSIKFTEKLENLIADMDVIEMGISVLYLRLLGIDSKNAASQRLIDEILEQVKEKGNNIDSLALALLTEMLSLEKERDLYAKMRMLELLAVINSKFKNCTDITDFYSLALCLDNIHPVLSHDAIREHKEKINQLIDQNFLNASTVKVSFKVLNFLNYPHWSIFNSDIIQRLLLSLENAIPEMSAKELLKVNRALFVQHEPVKIIPLLRDRAHELLEETKDVELLQIVCMYCSPQERTKFVEMLREKVLHYQTKIGPESGPLTTYFKILRLLKIPDTDLCDCFWTKIVNKIFSLRETDLKYRLPKFFYRYMNFNNNLGGTYRHIEFEKIVYEYCVEELKTTSSFLPKSFAKFASFVIAYSDQYDCIPDFIIEKIIVMQEQFNVMDVVLLSRSLEILNGFKMRNPACSKTIKDQYEIISYVLDNCTKRHMHEHNLNIRDVNLILSSYVRRRSPRDSQIFYDIMKWYDRKLALNSRLIREICHSLQISNFSHDSICDQFFDYIVANRENVSGETVEKVLTTCYNLSYFPDNLEALECCSQIVQRDFNIMNGLAVVQALLALTFYKTCPYDLCSRVFHSDFIKRLEQEIEMAYSKDVYPQRVLQLVMQLNRAICLDNPEYNIRWFQQNFIEAQLTKKPAIRSKFHQEVHKLLLNIVPSHDFLAVNRVTPYGYRIDFEVHVDGNFNKFLKPNFDDYQNVNFKPKVHKVAILLLGFDTFCTNDINRLKGSELLRMRHLEMMNYKVVHIKKSDFKILYENFAEKIKLLKNLLRVSD